MRSIWKGPFITQKIYNQITNVKKKVYFIKKKNSVILPEFVDLKVKVYNGQKFIDLLITSSMIGYKFGTFIFTRKLHKFKN